MSDTPANFVPVNHGSKVESLMQTKELGEKGSGRFILPMGRVVFAGVDKKTISKKAADKIKASGREVNIDEDGSYGIAVVIHPDADLKPLIAHAELMAQAAFQKKVGIKYPWLNADEKHEPYPLGLLSLEGYKKLNANSYHGPITVKDQANKKVETKDIPALLYNGAFVRVEVKCATFDNESKGIKLYLQGVQIVRNDPVKAPKIVGDNTGGENFDVITEDDDAAMDEAFA